MSFFKVSKSDEDVKQGGGNHIVSSGVYPITVLAPVVSVSKGGSTSVDIYLEHLGQKQIVYGNLRITNNDGSPNKIGAKIFNQLMIIAGLDEVADPVEQDLPIGKKEAMKTVAILEDLCDVEAYMRIQMEYGVWKGSITEKKIIKTFFRAEDKATAEEIVHESEAGLGFERERKYLDNVTYKDGVTAEQITAWISASRPDSTGGNAGETPAKAPSFGKQRFGETGS